MIPMYIPPVAAIIFPIESRTPSESQISDWTDEMVSEHLQGFGWSDIASLMQECADHFEMSDIPLTIEQKKNLCIRILHGMIDRTEIIFLPQPFFDPLYKEMVPVFAFLIFPYPVPQFQLQRPGPPDETIIRSRTRLLASRLPQVVDWKTIANVFLAAIHFTSEYSGMTAEEKTDIVHSFVDETLDLIDPSRLPSYFNLSVIHQMTEPMVGAYFGIPPS